MGRNRPGISVISATSAMSARLAFFGASGGRLDDLQRECPVRRKKR
jgi:hypothetical protein